MKLCIVGARGRMGTLVRKAAEEHPTVTIRSLLDNTPDDTVGNAANKLRQQQAAGTKTTDLSCVDNPQQALQEVDCYIDFSTPTATVSVAKTAKQFPGVGAIIGTTGLSKEDWQSIESLAKTNPVLFASNFSRGVNVLFDLCQRATQALGPGFDPEILELHHNKKKDAPSGTALSMAEAITTSRNEPMETLARYGQVGQRTPQEIGMGALRGGDIVGEHTAYFIGANERIEITHRASSRSIFAEGALSAALWIQGRSPGLYTMIDVLGLQ